MSEYSKYFGTYDKLNNQYNHNKIINDIDNKDIDIKLNDNYQPLSDLVKEMEKALLISSAINNSQNNTENISTENEINNTENVENNNNLTNDEEAIAPNKDKLDINKPIKIPNKETKLSSKTKVYNKDLIKTIKTIYNFFTDKGLPLLTTAALLGVGDIESGLNPYSINMAEKKAGKKGYGIGIPQFSGSRHTNFLNYLSSQNTDFAHHNVNHELNYIWSEIESRPKLKNALLHAKSLNDAVYAVHMGYENGDKNNFMSKDLYYNTYTLNPQNGQTYELASKTRLNSSKNMYVRLLNVLKYK